MSKEDEKKIDPESPLKKILRNRVTWEIVTLGGLAGGIAIAEYHWRHKKRKGNDPGLHPAQKALMEHDEEKISGDSGQENLLSAFRERGHIKSFPVDTLLSRLSQDADDSDYGNPIAEIMQNVRTENREMSSSNLVREIASAIVKSTQDEKGVADRHKLFHLLSPTMKLRRSLKNQNTKILDLSDGQVADLIDELAGAPQKLDKKTVGEIRSFFGATQGTLDEIILEVIHIVRNKEFTRLF